MAIAGASIKALKTEFVKQMKFENSEQLEIKLFDSVNWYNCFRPHLHYSIKHEMCLKNC
ncbi:hypothetical protein CJ205_08145 [Dolosicoccus paucivorans]|uniref:Integrase catalytic domain-containing protein n=1 Tax=Dolosicoccus paucivorans TaxID=84521 RepID=A0A2N6SL00_9LACT|nr:hypothetical protein CJ206_08285 [Dolosicoccus paucivorans]PMC57178.1 hypothetical protein CJ205_08145 [Dolosicoccus paucivorans]